MDLIKSIQICDGILNRKISISEIIDEARNGRLLPGNGDFEIKKILSYLNVDTTICVEYPDPKLSPISRIEKSYKSLSDLF